MRAVQRGEFEGGSVFIDGDWKPLSEAKISLFDWGFTRSDATYDVASVWKGAFFRLDDHLDRFFASLAKLRMSIPYSRAEVRAILHGCVAPRGLRRRLCGDGVHARRAAARLARSAPGDEPLLRLRAAVRLDRAARQAARRASTCTSATAGASRPSRSIRRSRTTTGSTSCSRSSTPTTAARDTSCVVDAARQPRRRPGLQPLRGPGRRRPHARSRRARRHLAAHRDRAVRAARHSAASRAGSGRRSRSAADEVFLTSIGRRHAADRENRRPCAAEFPARLDARCRTRTGRCTTTRATATRSATEAGARPPRALQKAECRPSWAVGSAVRRIRCGQWRRTLPPFLAETVP